jgi:hypothetical protein
MHERDLHSSRGQIETGDRKHDKLIKYFARLDSEEKVAPQDDDGGQRRMGNVAQPRYRFLLTYFRPLVPFVAATRCLRLLFDT